MIKFALFCLSLSISISLSSQNRFDVSSSQEFIAAHSQATSGDTIAWRSGIYYNTRMDIDKDGLIVTAETNGTVLFTGVSRAIIYSNDVTFSGFQYIGGRIGNLDVIGVYGSDILITQINIQNYTSHKYLVVHLESRNITISYCNFENRLNLDDKNILSILVDDEPGYHKIQYCSFKNFDGIGNDMGIEPIRIGVSTQGDLDSRTLVEYCYFTQCNGDGEIISHKSRQNVYRYNTFEDNPVAELVLRHGDEGIVYGNFFLNNMGGIRVREGSKHFLYNNYFEGLERRAIFLQNDPSDPLSDIHIYHNTIVDCEEIRLGGNGSNPPDNVTIANNVFTNPKGQLFDEETGSETWTSNIAFGTQGIDSPSTGLLDIDPKLSANSDGFLQPEADSPVIAAASDDYNPIPLYPGMEYDNQILLDIMKENRPSTIEDRAIGASEYSATTNILPHATELNTGPSYLFDDLVDYLTANVSQLNISKDGANRTIRISSNTDWVVQSSDDWISTDITSGSKDSRLELSIDANDINSDRSAQLTISNAAQSVSIDIFQDPNAVVNVIDNIENPILLYPNPSNDSFKLSNLPPNVFQSSVEIFNTKGQEVYTKVHHIENRETSINISSLPQTTYLVHVKLISAKGKILGELSRNFIKI